MTDKSVERVSASELAAEGVTALPAKEVMSLLDLNANLDLALDTAAPIDLAIGANANVAAPIEAAVSANVLSPLSTSAAVADQGAAIHQGITGNAEATSHQASGIAQGAPAPAAPPEAVPPAATSTPGSPTSGNLLDVNVNLNGNLHLAAPIDGSVAANANVAAPIDAAASANIASIGSQSVASAHQDALISQDIHGNAGATADQASAINQGSTPPSSPPPPSP